MSEYKRVSVANLPDPVIDPNDGEEPRDYFETFIYTGNGTGLQVGDVIRKPAVTGIIDNSLIFDDSSNHYLSGTTGSADTTFTVSMWFKRANDTANFMYLYSSGSNGFALDDGNDRFYVYNGSVSSQMGPVIRDAFWHHVVYSQSSGSFTLYLDGIQIGTGTGFTLSTTSGATHIGHYAGSGDLTFDGYIADVNFVSGTALNATSFGAFDANGVWSPVEPSVTYGSSGYRLQFEDATSTTTLGNDTSGNNNDFTLNNMAVSDQVTDSPTNNFCVLDPNTDILSANGNGAISDGNLKCTWSATNRGNRIGTIGLTSGKWYFEADYIDNSNSTFSIGFISDYTITNQYDGVKSDLSTGGIKSVAVDLDNDLIWFAESGTFVGDPAAGTGGTAIETGYQRFPTVRDNSSSTGDALTVICNFGQNGTFLGERTAGGNADSNGQGNFFYAPPTGFLALCENNISNDENLESPDWVWIKNRSATANHQIYDSVRGVQKVVSSNATTAETDNLNGVVDFNKNGFTVGNDASVNTDGNNYVAWCWKAGGTAASNTNGSITSTVSANTEAGFSIVSYTGTNVSGATVGHGLTQAPDMIIIKNRDGVESWPVYHSANTSAPETDYLVFNTNAASLDATSPWNDTAPTSSVFSLGNWNALNENGSDHVAYCFHSVEGYSKFGSYVGNESATKGPFTYTGFKPAYVMVKNRSTTGSWVIIDSTRTPDNSFLSTDVITGDGNGAQESITDTTLRADFFSNGFTFYSGSNSYNNSGSSYIYMAFAETPFKYATAR